MKTKDLEAKYYMFGNKGAMWSNKAHIYKSGSFSGRTLCGTPMLSTNWCDIEGVKEIGCPKCLTEYKKQTG